MLKTLLISFKLKNTYLVNSILHGFRQIPLIKKLFPPDVYSMTGFKVFAYVLAVLWGIFSTFAFKLLYFMYAVYIWKGTFEIERSAQPQFFFHLLIPLTFVGAFANNYMFTPEKHKYYAMMQLGMDAKKFTLSNYFFCLAKYFIGFTVCSLIFGTALHLKPWQCMLFVVFAACAKTAVCLIEMIRFKKGKKTFNEDKNRHITHTAWRSRNNRSIRPLCIRLYDTFICVLRHYGADYYRSFSCSALHIQI